MRRIATNTLYKRLRTGLASDAIRAHTTASQAIKHPFKPEWEEYSLHSLAAAGFLTVAALTLANTYKSEGRSARCAAELPLPNANPKTDQFIDEFRHWLRRIDGDTTAIDVRPCSEVKNCGTLLLLVQVQLINASATCQQALCAHV